MTSAKAYTVLERDGWTIVKELLEKGELSTADINQPGEVR